MSVGRLAGNDLISGDKWSILLSTLLPEGGSASIDGFGVSGPVASFVLAMPEYKNKGASARVNCSLHRVPGQWAVDDGALLVALTSQLGDDRERYRLLQRAMKAAGVSKIPVYRISGCVTVEGIERYLTGKQPLSALYEPFETVPLNW